MDAVGFAAVIGSNIVALASLSLTFMSARKQRKHDAARDFEARVWEHKSAALFSTIERCLDLVDRLNDNTAAGHQARVVGSTIRLRKTLEGALPVVHAYASDPCRQAFWVVDRLTREVEYDVTLWHLLDRVRTEIGQTTTYADDAAAEHLDAEERRTLEALAPTVRYDANRLEKAVRELLRSARESLRNPYTDAR